LLNEKRPQVYALRSSFVFVTSTHVSALDVSREYVEMDTHSEAFGTNWPIALIFVVLQKGHTQKHVNFRTHPSNHVTISVMLIIVFIL
jgi:hypothetical protein